MFYICGIVVWGCLYLEKGSDNAKRTRRLSKEEIKQHLIDSSINNDKIETEQLNEKAGKVLKSENATNIIREYKEIMRKKRKTLHASRIIKEKFLENAKINKSLWN